ncbi:hypothetical protein EI94DRAFT_1870772 [Lactarius quietus]|nr:hypothetical protein EI94DRAFT_1870772 [Lactarius quietus]
MLASLITGPATSATSNPVWNIQPVQIVHGVDTRSADTVVPPPQKYPCVFVTATQLLKTCEPAVFFHGHSPALVLVVNPVLQYSCYWWRTGAVCMRNKLYSYSKSCRPVWHLQLQEQPYQPLLCLSRQIRSSAGIIEAPIQGIVRRE